MKKWFFWESWPGLTFALDDLFAQVLGMLSAEGLITLERVTLDGTKGGRRGNGRVGWKRRRAI